MRRRPAVLGRSDASSLPDRITVDEYFTEGLRYGDQRVTVVGDVASTQVSNYLFSDDKNFLITLYGTEGEILVDYLSRYWEDEEQKKDLLRNLEPGDRIEVFG